MRKFLLLGKTGVGKSSFINAAFGQSLARTLPFEACTKFVEYYADNTPIGNVYLIDTPGLAEGDEELDKEYLSLIRTKVDLDRLYTTIYISRLDETRFRRDERETLNLITSQLGAYIWNRSWLVFTFAASVPLEQRQRTFKARAKQIVEFLQSITKRIEPDKPFQEFQAYYMTDNLVNDWSSHAVPILSVLTD